MSRLFKESSGVVVDVYGVVHQYDTWRQESGQLGQYTDCGSYLGEDMRGEYTRLRPDRYDCYLTCIACAVDRRYRP